jgi:hypothetical protein
MKLLKYLIFLLPLLTFSRKVKKAITKQCPNFTAKLWQGKDSQTGKEYVTEYCAEVDNLANPQTLVQLNQDSKRSTENPMAYGTDTVSSIQFATGGDINFLLIGLSGEDQHKVILEKKKGMDEAAMRKLFLKLALKFINAFVEKSFLDLNEYDLSNEIIYKKNNHILGQLEKLLPIYAESSNEKGLIINCKNALKKWEYAYLNSELKTGYNVNDINSQITTIVTQNKNIMNVDAIKMADSCDELLKAIKVDSEKK